MTISPQDRGRAKDKKLAKMYGGRAQPGSGNQRQAAKKGDVKTQHELIESKCTDAASYVLQLATLRKMIEEALAQNRMPILLLDIQGDEFAVMRKADFDTFREYYWSKEM